MADENNSDEQLDTQQIAAEVNQPQGQAAVSAVSEADISPDAGEVAESVEAEVQEPAVVEESASVAESADAEEAGVDAEDEDDVEEEEASADPADLEFSADDIVDDDYEEEDEEDENVSPLEEFVEAAPVVDDEVEMNWYILKVQVNREKGICEALKRQVAQAGMEHYFSDVLVPTEDVREFTKAGKQRITKRKLYPGYIVVRMAINDDSWFLVRETSGIGDFAGASGSPVPLSQGEIDRILQAARPEEQGEEEQIKTAIPFKIGERVRIKEGYFQNYEGDISNIDERNGRIEVMIDIFGRPNPVDMDHWHAEKVG